MQLIDPVLRAGKEKVMDQAILRLAFSLWPIGIGIGIAIGIEICPGLHFQHLFDPDPDFDMFRDAKGFLQPISLTSDAKVFIQHIRVFL